MKTTSTKHKVVEAVVGASVGAAIAGPAGAVVGGIIGSPAAAHIPRAEDRDPVRKDKESADDDPIVHAALRRILVPLDFSPPSRRALRFAREWAVRFGAEVCLLHVIEPMNTFGVLGVDPIEPPPTPADFRDESRAELESLAREVFGSSVKVSTEVCEGMAFHEIVAWAREWKADLIIIATHGRRGLPRALLGSTAEQVVRHAPCPVLTLRRAIPH